MNTRHPFSKRNLIASVMLLSIWVGDVASTRAETFNVNVDLTEQGEPISKYIYGQFIEHLGRCIYGGIWSEMLEDRKFYYPVTGDAPAWNMYRPGTRSFDGEGHPYELLTRSPWMIVGDKQAVTMVSEDSFVGDLCREIDTEAFIAVNTGQGGIQAAAEEIEYVNGGAETAMGELRAKNGHPQPYGVKWWAIGNEMYGNWQLGHMPLEDYVKKHNRVVDAMRKVDPTFKPIAVGAKGPWSEQMLTTCANHMDLISEHLYWVDKDDVVSHVSQIAQRIREVAEAHRSYRKKITSLADRDIRIALDEWNYWYGPNEYGELGTQYFLQDGLGMAVGLHEFFRNSDIYFMANYAQTVNVIGAIKTTKTEAELETTGLVLKLYRQNFGTIPVPIDGDSQPLDISAAFTPERDALTVAVVNPTEVKQKVALSVQGGKLAETGKRWTLTGPDKWSHNAPGKPRQVDIVETVFSGNSITVDPLSVTLVCFAVQ